MSRAAPAASLRRQLLWLVLAAIALASVLQAGTAYRSALIQADLLFDEHLRELATSVRQGAVPDSYDLQVQIWSPEGVEIFRSTGSRLPQRALLGFSDVTVQGTHWRVYAVQTPEQTIQVAQDRDARQARARALALRAMLPVALLAPLLMAAVWWLITRSLAPVESMRQQVAARPADDLSALPEDGLPEEVLPLVQELNLLFGRVRLAFDTQRHFVADAAHELRSPLAALKLQAQALRRGGDEAQRELALRRLEAGIERSIRLVGQMLALARAEGEPATAPRDVELQHLAREAIIELLPSARERDIDLGMETQAEAHVAGEPEALHILLRNLVENAIKYAPAGGRVDISIAPHDAGASLVVEDSGPGIPDDQRDRVFDRFYRTPDATAGGSGLGLAIVRAIAQQHGATVTLGRSERLGGLRVEVRFPGAAVAAA